MSPKAPADAVREAPTERVLALLAKHGGWQATLDHIADLEARLAAPARAAPVAWDFQTCDEPRWPGDGMRHAVYDASEAARLRSKGYAMRPLYDHAPAKAREVTEGEIIALVAGPFKWHHKMDAQAEREAKAFNRCRELTIQKVQTYFANRRAALATFAEGENPTNGTESD